MHVNKNQLGFLPELLSVGASLIGASSGGSAASPAMAPSVQAQISPQISPVFQQQFQPSNSAMSAGTAQSLAPMGAGAPAPSSGGYAAPAVPTVPQAQTGQEWQQYIPWLIGGAVIIIAVKTFKKRA